MRPRVETIMSSEDSVSATCGEKYRVLKRFLAISTLGKGVKSFEINVVVRESSLPSSEEVVYYRRARRGRKVIESFANI